MSSSVEKKAYSTWNDQKTVRSSSAASVSFTIPSGVYNIKRVDWYFNEQMEWIYGSYTVIPNNVESQNTITLTSETQFDISCSDSAMSWYFGLDSSGTPYMYAYRSNNSGSVYWNIALTFYY